MQRLLWLKWVFLLYLESDTLLPDPLPNLAHFFMSCKTCFLLGMESMCLDLFLLHLFQMPDQIESIPNILWNPLRGPFLSCTPYSSWKKTQQGFLLWPQTPLLYYCHSATAPLISISLVISVSVLFVTVNELQDTSVLLFNTAFSPF